MKLKTSFLDKRVYITSDTHYAHKNLCRGATAWNLERAEDSVRDFDTLEQMNDAIVNGINSEVGQDDILISLGDWSFGGFENIKKFRERIWCKNIILILGNHDHHIEANRDNCRDLFDSVYDGIVELEYTFKSANCNGLDTKKFVLSHYPIASWNGMNKGVMHLHGHVHFNKNMKFAGGRAMDVGMDGNDMKPYDLFKVIKLLQDRPIKSMFKFDHHNQEVK